MTKKDILLLYRNSKEEPWIGGPGTKLPRIVESFLSWTVALTMLSVSGYHYIRSIYIVPAVQKLLSFGMTQNNTNNNMNQLPCWLELTTASRSEQNINTIDRHEQLVQFLQKTSGKMAHWTHEELITIIRESHIARRLVSLVLRPTTTTTTATTNETAKTATTTSSTLTSLLPKSVLQQLWPHLLRLPPPDEAESFKYDISVIIPAFREHGVDVQGKLERALGSCQNPKRIEIVIVDAGECIDLRQTCLHTTSASSSSSSSSSSWGSLRVVPFTAGGGRGPCLNYGASQSTGRILAFVHSDTILPPHWDTKIVTALDGETVNHDRGGRRVRANSCTFGFGIDTSMTGLNGGPYPPGIKAVETTANLRTQMYSLPYGDQTLSIPAVIFHFLGGFPDQCLMEDYELISLLRRRAALLPKFAIDSEDDDNHPERERLVVIGGTPALCSPRRWQKYGVLYVTFMNSKLVNFYAGGMTPDSLFAQYYGQPPPKRKSDLAPWEEELQDSIVLHAME